MISFMAEASKTAFQLSGEVDEAIWVSAPKALGMVRPAGRISHTLLEQYLREAL